MFRWFLERMRDEPAQYIEKIGRLNRRVSEELCDSVMANRRKFLKTTGAIGTIGLAGCMGGGGSEQDTTTASSDTTESSGSDTTEATETTTESSGPAYGNGELNFLMSPSEPQDLMSKQYEPVKEHLDQELSVPTKLKYARNYSAVIQALGSGTGDVAEMGPFAAALGVNSGDVDIGLQRKAYGAWKYSSVIVTKKDSDVTKLSDLKGKKVAFADRLSASGALFPLYMLKQAGLSIGNLPSGSGNQADFDATFSGHSTAFKALESGQADAAGVGQFITLNDSRKLKEGYEYVKTYDGIPRAPIATSVKLSDSEKKKVVDALKNAPEKMYLGADGKADTDKESDNPDDDLWFSDVRPATIETYQPVIDVAKELGIKTDLLDSGGS